MSMGLSGLDLTRDLQDPEGLSGKDGAKGQRDPQVGKAP